MRLQRQMIEVGLYDSDESERSSKGVEGLQ